VRQVSSATIIAWFWVALAFMLINGTVGQRSRHFSGSMEKHSASSGDHLHPSSRIGYDAACPHATGHVPSLRRNPLRSK